MENGTRHKKFEEIPVWIKSRELCKEVYSLTKQKPFCFDKGLTDQITRAAVSVLSNIAEGVERGSTAELINFLFIAKGSVGEVRAQLYVAEDQDYIPFTKAQLLRNQAEVVSKQLSGWIQTMQSLDFNKGSRFHKEESKSDKFHIEGKKWLEDHVKKINESRGLNSI